MKYKLSPYDLANDIWIIKKKFLFFWIPLVSAGVGSKKKMENLLNNLN